MTGCSMAAKRMGNDLITGKKKISDVSNSMKTATASTKALGVAMNVFANVGFMLAITAVTKVVTELAQAQSKAVEAAHEATESYKEELVSLEDYKTKISELHEELSSENISYKDSKTIREELLTLQDELIKKYGNEKTAIENITTAIKGEVNALDELNEKAYRDWIAKADKRSGWNKLLPWGQSGLDQAIDYMETEKTVSFFDMSNANSTTQDKYQAPITDEIRSIQEEIDKTIQSKYNLEKEFATFKLIGTPEEIKSQLEAVRQDYLDLSKEAFLENGISSEYWEAYRSEAINSINEVINKFDDGLKKHQETYQTYIEGMIKYDSEYSDEYANILQKRAALESAENSGNADDIRKARQEFMDSINNGIQASGSDENIKKYFESLYPELQAEFANWNFEVAINANTDELADKAKEIGEKYSASDLLDMVNTEGTQEGEESFNKLIDKAIEYGVCTDKSAEEVQKLIDLLVELGIVQDNVQGSTLNKTHIFSSLSDFLASASNSSIKSDLIGLSQAGKLNKDTIKEYEYFNDILEALGKSASISDDELEKMIKTIESLANKNPVDYLKNYNDQISKLSDAYIKFSTGERIDATILSSLQDAFGNLDSYKEFENAVLSGEKELQQYFDKMATELSGNVINDFTDIMDVTDGLTETNKEYYKAELKASGIKNAEIVVESALAQKQEKRTAILKELQTVINNSNGSDVKLLKTTEDLTTATFDEISAMVQLADNAGETTEYLAAYALEKADANDIKIDTEADIKRLSALCEMVGATTYALDAYQRVKNGANGISSDAVQGLKDAAQREIENAKKLGEDLLKNYNYSVEFEGNDKTKAEIEKAKSNAKSTFDWIETAISRVQRLVTNLGKTVSATWKNWSTRNNALAQEMNKINEQIQLQANAYSAYMAKANSVGLSNQYIRLIQNGGLRIDEITDEALIEQINSYKEWYEKALSAKDAIDDLQDSLAELAKTKFDNISKKFNTEISVIQHSANMINSFIDQAESAGMLASEAYYKALSENQRQQVQQLTAKYNELLSSFNEAVQTGTIQKYSEDWYSMLSDINDVEEALQDANVELTKFEQTLQQLSWDIFDRISSSVSDLNTETEFLSSLMDYYGNFDENGNITEYGLASQGLLAQRYNTYMEQASAYASEIEKIKKEIENDPYDLELTDRLSELTKSQQDAIKNAIAEKEAISDLVKEGYDKMLSSLDEIIAKRKEALDAEKSLYDYEKSVNEQTKDIASYRKQLLAYTNDNSEQAKMTIQKLQVSLADAEEKLRETEYDRWKSDQEQMLDTLASQTEEWVNRRLDNIDGLVAEAIIATNKSAQKVSSTIEEVTKLYGYQITDTMDEVWNRSDNVVGMYGDLLYGVQLKGNEDLKVSMDEINANLVGSTGLSGVITDSSTGIQNALNGITTNINNMIQALNQFAQDNANNIASLQNAVIKGQSSNITSNQPVFNQPPIINNSTNGSSDNNGSSSSIGAGAIISAGTGIGQISSKWKITGDISTGRIFDTKADAVSYINSKGCKLASTDLPNKTVKAKKISIFQDDQFRQAYANGSKRITKDEIAWTQENGTELLYRAADGAMLTPLGTGDKVFTKEMSDNLWNIASNPVLANISTPKIPNIQRSASNVNNDIQMHITLPNVKNYDEFVTQLSQDKRFEKVVQSMTIDQALGKNSLSKYRY